jgi:2,5-dihydroxypyridine 5,6-dioxygenase
VIARWAEIMAALREVFEQCLVRADEKVAVYIDTGRPVELGQLLLGIASSHGCDAWVVTAQTRRPTVPPPPGAVAAMRAADVVFDLATNSWLYSPATQEILADGARILQVRAPESRFTERGPREPIVRKAREAERLFKAAHVLRITSPEGTDLTIDYSGREPLGQDGVVREPGDWDSLGTAFCNVCPPEESAGGTIVLNGPVYLSGDHSFITREPIRLTVRSGRVVTVDGGEEARRFEAYLDSHGDPASRVIAHVGFGYDPTCGPPARPVEAGDTGSWEAMNGGVILAFGANRGVGRWGGTNVAPTHSDCVLLGADFHLGDTQVIRGGTFVVPGLQA